MHPGKELSKDAVKYTMRTKAHPREFIEKKKHEGMPGPSDYLERSNLDYFAKDIRYNNKFSNPQTSSFGNQKRFSFPTATPAKSPSPNHYTPKSYWKMDAQESIFKNNGAAVFARDKTDILKQKYHIREKMQVPAPGNYNSAFSEFSGGVIGPP